MNVEIITTGTELLLGEIVNTNFPYLAKNLNRLGFNVLYGTTVGDNPERMRAVLQDALRRADIIITSGGLGPTRGDITKEMIADVCGVDCHFDQAVWEKILNYFRARHLEISDNNKKQAYVPNGAQILSNPVGTAPGLWLEHDNRIIIMLPGPPHELQTVCEKEVWGRLLTRFAAEGIILSRVLHLRKIGESLAASLIDEIVKSQSNPTIALYARNGEVIIRLTAKAADVKSANRLLDACVSELQPLLTNYLYGVDDVSLASCVGEMLTKRGESVALAESCSGGLATSLLTDVPGSSAYLWGSMITYNNQVKEKLLGVSGETLRRFSAVSKETACEMAKNVRRIYGCTYGIGITGNAGPEASEGKPVGLVYIALADAVNCLCHEFHFSSTRTNNKLRIAQTAISLLLDKILEQQK